MRRLQRPLTGPQSLDLGANSLQVPLTFANLRAGRLAGQHRLTPHPGYCTRQGVRAEVGRVFAQNFRLQRFKIGARGGRSTKCMTSGGAVRRTVQEVAVLACRAGEVDEAR